MKKTVLSLLALCFVAVQVSCQKERQVSSSAHTITTNGRVSHNMTIVDHFGSLHIAYEGQLQFSEDEKSIAVLSPGSELTFRHNNIKIRATSDTKGQISYLIYEDGKKIEVDLERGQKILAEAIQTMIKHGIDAKGSVERLYKKGGKQAVMDKVASLQSDYIKGIYLDYLLQSDKLNGTELSQVAQQIGQLMESDYEKAKLLEKNVHLFLAHQESTSPFFQALRGIHSDYEKAKVLKGLLQQNLDAKAFAAALNVAGSINSDYEKAGVLKTLINKGMTWRDQFGAILDISGQIRSDYEKAGVLEHFIKHHSLEGENWGKFAQILKQITSDYEQAGVIKAVLDKQVPSGNDFDQLLATLDNMDSDYEKAGVLKKIANQEIKTEAQWLSLVGAARNMTSAYEKSNVLIHLANLMPRSEALQAAYMQAAKSINSDHEYGRVLRALK
jgi:hypothetical protein